MMESAYHPGFACCFCGASIDEADTDAVELVLRNAWIDGGRQTYWSHSKCIASRITGYPVEFEVLRDPDSKPASDDPWD